MIDCRGHLVPAIVVSVMDARSHTTAIHNTESTPTIPTTADFAPTPHPPLTLQYESYTPDSNTQIQHATT
eukprot:555775-Prorocentrum_lima.AAC.1